VAKPKAKKDKQSNPNQRSIAQNRKAGYNFLVIDTLECGIALVGSEVKSLRGGKVSIEESFAKVKDGEVWLMGCDIAEYTEANQFNHPPKRPRKLLMHRREIKRFAALAFQKGLTLVPLKLYFKEGKAKVLLGLCKGKQKHDKREAMKQAEARRDMQRQIYRRR
jgi:SsrA-binding protein